MNFPSLVFLATEVAEHAAPGSAGVLGTLGLNWKLFLAQLVNFGVVIFILWKWVMKPVVGALEARRIRIEESVKKAGEIEKKFADIKAYEEGARHKSRIEADELITRASLTGETLKNEAAERARAESAKILSEARVTIASEKERALLEIREEVAGLAVMAAEKILRAKLDEKKDAELIKNMMKSL
ncbi:MAG: F0F1 ATP synthase subunit B [Candidatus Doudnabacteria bacterium]|nr:F0F1 ATP synthase subunit B [bacterium]MDZ4243959.1 F0F1 ATP synthase subunit B [Candidatus Doudnabacteria bacterium]